MNWAGVVYNAVDLDQWPYTPEKDDYLLAFGRVAAAKGFHHSIEAAKRTGQRLIMAGVVQEPLRRLLRERVEPHIDGEQIIFEGEVSDERKRELFAHARGVPVPHHLAGAVRSGDDRGHGHGHAGGGPAPGLGARGRGRTGAPASCATPSTSSWRRWAASPTSSPRPAAASVEQSASPSTRMVDGYEAVYRRLLEG